MSKTPNSTDQDDTPRKRQRGAGVMAWVLIAMLVAGLGGFGIENFGGGTTAIGRVGDTEITANDYAREMQAQVRALSDQFGTPITMDMARSLGLESQVTQSLVSRAALDNEAAAAGLSVGDAAVAAELAKIPTFQGVDGTFDRKAYGQILAQNKSSEAEFEASLRRDAARNLLTGAVASGTVAPAVLTDALAAWAGEKRSLSLLVLDETALDAPLPAPTEAEVKAHYDANIAAYTRPEAKRIQYAALLPATLAPSIEVPEDEVKKAYDARIAEFMIPEKRLVERLVYPDDAAAAAAKAKLDAGTPFEDLVKDRGLTLQDIDLGDVSKSDLAGAGEAVFALTEPGVVGPLPSDLGPALFRMNAVLAAQETTYEQARPDLLLILQTEAAAKAIADKVEAIDDALAGGATLEDLAKDYGMTLATTDYAPGADDNDTIAGYAAFRAAAEKLAEGDFPEATLLDDGGLVTMQLLETLPPTPVPLDKITDKVTEATRAAALATALSAKAATLKAAVDSGASLETLGTPTALGPLDRQAAVDGLPPAVLAAAFQMAVAEVRLIDQPGFAALLRLDSITPLATDETDLRAAIAANIERALSEDIATLFSSAVMQKAGITLDQAAISAINSQLGN